MSLLSRFGIGFILLLFFTAVQALLSVPELSHRVTDITATLTAEQTAALDNKLAAFEAEKGSQIAVLILPTTQTEDIAQFGIRLAEAWKIGREKIDDGVILIVAKDDRKLRIEVGYGLEGVIPDAIAKRVISEIITPYFKTGDFAGGIDAGVSQLIKLISGEPLPAPSGEDAEPEESGAFLLIFFGGWIIGLVLSLFMGRVMGGMLAGLGAGLIGFVFFGLATIFSVFIGLMIFGMVAARNSNNGGWTSGGGGFGGGGGGSSSWGGGGGSFGGGGASGSW